MIKMSGGEHNSLKTQCQPNNANDRGQLNNHNFETGCGTVAVVRYIFYKTLVICPDVLLRAPSTIIWVFLQYFVACQLFNICPDGRLPSLFLPCTCYHTVFCRSDVGPRKRKRDGKAASSTAGALPSTNDVCIPPFYVVNQLKLVPCAIPNVYHTFTSIRV